MPTCLALFLLILAAGCGIPSRPPQLRIAVPYSDNVQDMDSNYYVNWLEEQTGQSCEFTLIRQKNSTEYLDALFASETDTDIILFGADFSIDETALQKYIDAGYIYTGAGRPYWSSYGTSQTDPVGQVLWINQEWLKKLNLPIPQTTGELEEVLRAFRDRDPNGNGQKDELPLVGTHIDYACDPVEFILNAYGYNDPNHDRSDFASSDAFRKGLIFTHTLFEEGLLDPHLYTHNMQQFTELINSPADLVGAFTTRSISDVVYPDNPEIMARFMHISPLIGPEGKQYALYAPSAPTVGAVITTGCKRPDDAAAFLNTMISPEASLIARYGEPHVDWEYTDGSDVSVYGGASTIVTKNYIWNTPQNKHLNGIGPMDVPTEYIEGITWNGVNSDAEYADARARMNYRTFLPTKQETAALRAADSAVNAYIDHAVRDFVCGVKDITRDEEWNEFVNGLSKQH